MTDDGHAPDGQAARPDPSDVRAVLREHGHQPPERGRLHQHWYDLYDQIASGAAGPDGGGLYDAGVTAADFPEGEAESPAAERRPRRPRTPRSGLRERLSRAAGGGQGQKHAKASQAKPKRPRVPVDHIVGLVWEGLGRMFTPISPATGRCLQLQAPITGLVLEDVVRGTFADRALQPLARAEEKGKKVIAVAAPPMIVLALEQAQRLPDPQRMAREAVLIPMLREALVIWDEVAGDKLEEQLDRSAARGPAYERADRIMAQIFAPPTPAGAGGHGTSPEDEAAAAAQAHMAGV